ncbi:hypothetical protein WN51_08533 [Melipona quadrifasciata]|uniref:Uncharacterized protein n=1 Tax=Melipona quadrifasciata TaxID=166423 RepID=A0A0N0U6T2_9HYME|nr:hypothetical protein WN51_08533 [Melipona quadrifasciata]
MSRLKMTYDTLDEETTRQASRAKQHVAKEKEMVGGRQLGDINSTIHVIAL